MVLRVVIVVRVAPDEVVRVPPAPVPLRIVMGSRVWIPPVMAALPR